MRTAGSASDEAKVLVFEVSGCACALPVNLIRDVAHRPALTRLPSQPSLIEGFLNYHGRAVAVVMLARLLGLPEHRPGLYAPLLLLGRGSDIVGVLVDSLDGVVSFPSSSLQTIPANHSLNNCAAGQFQSDERTVVLLAPERILLDEERRRIEDLTAQTLRRLKDLSASDEGLPGIQ